MRILFCLCLTLIFNGVTAQLSCGTDQQYAYLMKHSETFRKTQEQKKPLLSNLRSDPAHPDHPDTIQVVVHIISIGGNPGSIDNPADATIQTMMRDLNRYFNGTYPDDAGLNRTIGVDVGVYFKLAERTASCEPTNGIIRIDGRSNSNYVNSGVSVEGLAGMSHEELAKWSYWDNTRFLNIWLVNKVGGNRFLGYGFYPTGTRTIFDGIIVQYRAAGRPYILAHELGHALSLYHTFNGSNNSSCAANRNCDEDGDLVCDTDPVLQYTNGCFTGAENPCTQQPFSNIVFNHMGYSCGAIFTDGQKTRMRASLLLYRSSWFEMSNTVPDNCNRPEVKFISFMAEKTACNSIQLQWRTTSEQNCKNYSVELSNDGVNFTRRANIDASGANTDTATYNFTYTANTNGKLFFRIRQNAFDGWSDHSNLLDVTLNCAEKENIVYPNPVSQLLNITTGSSLNNDIAIYNASGQLVNKWMNTAQKKFDVSHYEAGVYIIVINETVRLRFVKH